MSLSNAEPILLSKESSVFVITLNRPWKLNAFDQEMLDKWFDALEECRSDESCRAVVITGSGRGFCTGVDLDEVDPLETEMAFKKRLLGGAHRVARSLLALDRPLVAAVNGAAVGAGLDMALMCDLRVVADDAQLSFGYIRIGLFPGNGATFLLPRLVGTGRALELLWTGRRFSGREAVSMGLAEEAVDANHVAAVAAELAAEVAANPPDVVRAIKKQVYSGMRPGWDDAFEQIATQAALVRGIPEVRDHLAYRERRRP